MPNNTHTKKRVFCENHWIVSRQCFLFSLFFILNAFILQNSLCVAEENRFTQKIEWKADKNAFEYRLELKDNESNKSTFYTTEKTYMELHLKTGKYSYRIFVYDFLGREAAVSKWKTFEILKASQPKIKTSVTEPILLDDTGEIELDVDIDGIAADSIVELVSDSIKGSLVISSASTSASEIGKASKVRFKDVRAGKWRLKVINPSGLSSESDVTIEIQAKPVLTEQPQAQPVLSKDEKIEDETTEEHPNAVEEEPVAEVKEEEPVIEKTPILEEQPVVVEKQPKHEKTRPPYECKDINIMVGYSLPLCLVNTLDKKDIFSSSKFSFIPPDIKLSFFHAKTEKNRFGAELSFASSRFEWQGKSDFYSLEQDTSFYQGSFVFQRNIFSTKTFLSLKAGLGLMTIAKKAHYTVNLEGRAEAESKTYFFPDIQLGASIFAIPMKFVVAEAGFNFTNSFIDGKKSVLFFSPYFSLGFRL